MSAIQHLSELNHTTTHFAFACVNVCHYHVIFALGREREPGGVNNRGKGPTRFLAQVIYFTFEMSAVHWNLVQQTPHFWSIYHQ